MDSDHTECPSDRVLIEYPEDRVRRFDREELEKHHSACRGYQFRPKILKEVVQELETFDGPVDVGDFRH